jgi:diguanylate cyclase (GGDEF)-like protein
VRIVHASDRPNIGIGELGQMCEEDPVFRERLLSHVNSAGVGVGRRIMNVQHAISLLGVGGVRNVALEACIAQVAPPSAEEPTEDDGVLLGLCLRRGVAARACARKLSRSDLHDCFVVGLLLEVGLVSQSADDLQSALGLARSPAGMRVMLATAAGEENHPQRGARVAQSWLLDPETVQAIAQHHDAEPPASSLGAVAWVAERIAAVFEGGEPAVLRMEAITAGERVGLSAADIDDVLAELPKTVRETAAQFKREVDHQPDFDALLKDVPTTLAEVTRNYAELALRLELLLAEKDRIATQLDTAKGQLSTFALTDALTGLPTARAFDEALVRDLARADRFGMPLSIVIIDADHFQLLNETYGRHTGDAVLQSFAGMLRELVRATDIPARLAGERFGLILPNTELQFARNIAERLRKKVAELPLGAPGELRFTISSGIATTRGPGCKGNQRTLLDSANTALTQAKREGRNRTQVADVP